MLDLTNIVQTATGAGTGASVVPTLPTATTAGNGVFIAVLYNSGNFFVSRPAGFSLFDNQSGGNSQLSIITACGDTPGGQTSWTVTLGGTAAPMIWFVMEIAGAMSMSTRNPDLSSFSLCWDTFSQVGAVTGPASTVDTGSSINAALGSWGDEFVLAFATAYKASGVPPTVTGTVANTADGTAPTWVELVPTTVTATGTDDIRLDVYYGLGGGHVYLWAAKPTWTASTDLVGAYITALRGFSDPAQRTSGRAATNSMM